MTAIRPATRDDIPTLTELWHTGWHAAHAQIVPAALTELRTRDSFAQRVNDHLANTWVAENGAGFCMLDGSEVYQFYVSATAQGTGLATTLMQHAEMTLKTAGHRDIWLACSIGNARAARFYTKSGWINVGTKRIDLESSAGAFPLDIWRFEKTL